MPTLCLVMLLGTLALPALCAPGDEAEVWVGPMPFIEARTLRADYWPTLMDPAAWPTVLARADVFKSYLMVLPRDPVPGKQAPELSDEQMRALAAFLKERGLRTAFEVGGIRMAPDTPNDRAGEYTASHELPHLRRWLAAGGTIDYITTDHAVMMTVGSHFVQPDQHRDRGMSLEQGINELVDYYEIVQREIPGVRVGAIESLGFFTVEGLNGKLYPRTVPALPIWPFPDHLQQLVAAMKARGLQLDHFHVDFGYEGVRHDGGGGGRLDFGRILAVEACARSLGVKAGPIVNAFHERSVAQPDPAVASREARNRTLEFYRGYVEAGGTPEHLVIQTWQPYPDRTGPETDPDTVLGVARQVLETGP